MVRAKEGRAEQARVAGCTSAGAVITEVPTLLLLLLLLLTLGPITVHGSYVLSQSHRQCTFRGYLDTVNIKALDFKWVVSFYVWKGLYDRSKNLLEPVGMEFKAASEYLLNDSQEEQASPEHSDENVKKPLEEAMGSKPKEHVIDEVPDDSSDEDYCAIVEDYNVKIGRKTREPIVDQVQGRQKTVERAPQCASTVARPVQPMAVVKPIVRTDLPAYVAAQPRGPFRFYHPLPGERDPWVRRTQVYDLTITRFFHNETLSPREIEEREREQEQLVYELSQRIEMLRDPSYEQPMAEQQMGQGQENRVHQPQDQVVTATNDLGRLPINFFGCDSSGYQENETQRFEVDHANQTPPVLNLPLTSSHQKTSEPSQQVTTKYQPLEATNQPWAAVSQHPSARSHIASSNNGENGPRQRENRPCQRQNRPRRTENGPQQREDGPRFTPPHQENSGSFQTEENISPHP
ncbi:hypothetical protein STEG23_015249 [Scotinomys teguina]